MKWSSRWRRLALPLAGSVLVTLLKLALPGVLGSEVPFLLYGVVIATSGWVAGTRGAVLAAVMGVLLSWYFFLPITHSFRFGDAGNAVQLATFMVEASIVSAIVARLQRTQREARALALARERGLEAEIRMRERIQILSQLTAALSNALRRNEVSEIVVERGMQFAQADTCTLYAMNDTLQQLELLTVRGVAPEVVEHVRTFRRDSTSPVYLSLRTGKDLWIEDEKAYLEIYPELSRLPSSRVKAFWSVPLIAEGKPFGLLGMGFFAPRPFPEEEREFIRTVALHCAQALRRAELFDAELAARAQAEHARASLETTLRSIGDAVIATDASGTVTLMNPVAERLTGWTESDAIGHQLRTVFRIVNQDTRREVENPVARVLKEGAVVGLANHTVLIGRDPNQETPIDDAGAPIRSENGEIRGVVLVFRDVTLQHQAAIQREFVASALQALNESLDYDVTLARVAELAVPRLADWCVIDIVDASGEVRRLAAAHVDPEKVQWARRLAQRYPPRPGARGGVHEVIATGKPVLHGEISSELIRESIQDDEHARLLQTLQIGSVLIVPIRTGRSIFGAISLVYAESKRHYGQADLSFAEDFARQAANAIENARLYQLERQSRAAADASSRAKDEFLATVSHELRTPLNAILGWAELLSTQRTDESKRDKAFETIRRNAVAMAQLIDDLLDLSRIVSGRLRLELEPLQPNAVIEAALDAVRPSADAKQIRIETELASRVGPILADPARLQQIVSNLLSNAVKFTPQGGQVRVTLEAADSLALIRVEDSGRGIDPQFLPHVFAPFRQADGGITRLQGGLGLGLSIARHLVELHQGQIDAHSEGEGRGSTFSVRLPLAAPGEARRSARSRVSSGQRAAVRSMLENLGVLIVEDDADARQLLQSLLEDAGCRVIAADSVPAALTAIERSVPDLLISDIGLPGEDGYALIRRIRAHPDAKIRDLPALALTAYADAQHRWRALEAGYLMHMPKPLDPPGLIAAVANLSRHKPS